MSPTSVAAEFFSQNHWLVPEVRPFGERSLFLDFGGTYQATSATVNPDSRTVPTRHHSNLCSSANEEITDPKRSQAPGNTFTRWLRQRIELVFTKPCCHLNGQRHSGTGRNIAEAPSRDTHRLFLKLDLHSLPRGDQRWHQSWDILRLLWSTWC